MQALTDDHALCTLESGFPTKVGINLQTQRTSAVSHNTCSKTCLSQMREIVLNIGPSS